MYATNIFSNKFHRINVETLYGYKLFTDILRYLFKITFEIFFACSNLLNPKRWAVDILFASFNVASKMKDNLAVDNKKHQY